MARKPAIVVETSLAALSYKMCISHPPMQCLRNRPCPFYRADATGKMECHVADRAYHQKSCQMINNPALTVRRWTLANEIRK